MKQFMMIVGIIAFVLVVAVMGYFVFQGIKSREQMSPGLVDGALSACPIKPNAVCSYEGTDTEHFIAPITPVTSSVTPDMTSVAKTVEALGGRIVTLDTHYLAAEFSSNLFGFVDDLELLRDPSEGVIHVRAAARVGYSDMGVNRKRVEALRQQLEAVQ
ncbi:DUF1499 domain-containing protein [Amphritea opalescens]|uniref:DUF1499 domain-containing protein n=1 Tax=Amphritea opalescens TaxID=2490544 RepID=A0A430KQP6_9GAMM|nr:DUF1499 domain-containing protein [Amphritea opalescens]RTE65786.1 DUF1499 domain-containing protein [Amphritea opalescens]